ncbi:MAG: hypothetical protein QXI16_01460 [Sulfolobaceae archaeon]
MKNSFVFKNRYLEILDLLLNYKRGMTIYKITKLTNYNKPGIRADVEKLESFDLVKSVEKNGVKRYLVNIERIKRYEKGIFIRVKINENKDTLIFAHCPFFNTCNNCNKGGEIKLDNGNCKFYNIISSNSMK